MLHTDFGKFNKMCVFNVFEIYCIYLVVVIKTESSKSEKNATMQFKRQFVLFLQPLCLQHPRASGPHKD